MSWDLTASSPSSRRPMSSASSSRVRGGRQGVAAADIHNLSRELQPQLCQQTLDTDVPARFPTVHFHPPNDSGYLCPDEGAVPPAVGQAARREGHQNAPVVLLPHSYAVGPQGQEHPAVHPHGLIRQQPPAALSGPL